MSYAQNVQASTDDVKSSKSFINERRKEKIRKFLLGSKEKQGFLKQFFVYALLICIGFIYLYPILYMFSKSLMSLDDLLDTSINWIPGSLNFSNYAQAAKSMDFWKTLLLSIIIAGVPTILSVFSCALVGYGLATFKFPGRNLVLVLILITFVLPRQITMIPQYVLFSKLKMLSTLWSFVLPALTAVGLNAPIFILIFWQFFRQVPRVLLEAAKIDGAGHFKTFVRVSLPTAGPAILTVFLFSFVWYWNESYMTRMFVTGVATKSIWSTLVINLSAFETNYNTYAASMSASGTTATSLNESISMAGTMLSVLPLLIMYFVLQRYFIESIDRVGITGE